MNNYDVVTVLAERGARGEDSAHFELLDTVKAMFVEEQLAADYGRLIAYVKTTEPLLLQGGDASRADLGAMENLLKTFHDGWKAGIEINRDVLKSFANFKLGMDLLKKVLTQLLLYYTRFLDLVKHAHPGGAPFTLYILSIPTLMAGSRPSRGGYSGCVGVRGNDLLAAQDDTLTETPTVPAPR